MGKSVEAQAAGPSPAPAAAPPIGPPATPSAPDDRPGAPAGADAVLAATLADVLRVERVPPDAHFFTDLGADSLVMAHFCARVRKRADLPSVSMKDIYRYPTISALATALAEAAPGPAARAPVPPPDPAPSGAARPVGTPAYLLCGTLQLLTLLGCSFLVAAVTATGYDWMSAAPGPGGVYLRAVAFGAAVFLGLCALPVLAKWVLIGRWRPREIRIWGPAYFRFWAVRTLMHVSPLVLFVGSPLYVGYLRALGAKIGRDVTILSKHLPVCTDLLTVEAGTVIRKDAYFTCYRARAGVIRTGPVTLGQDVLINEATVLDIGTSLGDGAQLGHASSLHPGQNVPAGEHWHGSPAQRTDVDYRTLDAAGRGGPRVTYSVLQLLSALLVYLPLSIGGVSILLAEVPRPATLLDTGPLAFTTWSFYGEALVTSFVLFFGGTLVGLLAVTTVPRLLHLFLVPGKVYRLYGLHYSLHRAIARMTNVKFYTRLFGDSSYVVPYLGRLGYDLSRVEQTGSNFGTEVRQESPHLSTVGSGTMVADGLSIMNADYSRTSFRLSRVTIGPRNFLGNAVHYPPQGRTGDNCLLATKVAVPVDGPVREGVGLLGSPCFEIPRSVERDAAFDHLRSGDELRRHLAAKNAYNLRTMGLFLLVRWSQLFVVTLIAWAAADLYAVLGAVAVALGSVLALLFSVGHSVCVEGAATGFRRQAPRYCSIYAPYFWRHERFWKLHAMPLRFLNGTPFKSLFWRLLGARVGRRVFDDGCFLPERSLVTIGDHATLNVGSVIQCHSQEDGTFKSDRTTLGAGCTLGTGAFVHYGATVGDGAVLAPDSFLMKGEDVPRHARWGGNPAREMPDTMTEK
ncbi:peptide synthetase [Streptomyces albofaciens JCM 4342]|uniref:Pls/PosA family non-ribosomal peptide synthetase n=1 Tax=Streptomyces albofaciens TaxID=66866 RepID=UPI00123BB261|nr:Pls/PosA family non-ribosomal peptide synthetase [Streptomyces albofaciens]KAA6215208.1 peptide synthetase [Streptomyces albofaciens JCM 4342]